MSSPRTERQINVVARTQVSELLAHSASFLALPSAQRKALFAHMVAATKFLAQANGLSSALNLRLTETRDGKTQAVSVNSQVDFPGFVSGLLNGVFNSIVTSSIEQMKVYGALIAGVANDIDQFMQDNAEKSDEYLTQRWPHWFAKQSGQALKFNAEQKSVALNEVLSALAPETPIARPTLAKARKAARQTLAFERQQTALSDIGQAVARIVPSDRALSIERLPVSFPQVFIDEAPITFVPIQGVNTGIAGFVGLTAKNITGEPVRLVTSWSEFERYFGGIFSPNPMQAGHHFLPHAVQGFFANGGTRAYIAPISVSEGEEITDVHYIGATSPPTALSALAQLDDISILLAPGVTASAVQQALAAQCDARRDRICLLDLPLEMARPWSALSIESSYAAAHWPWLISSTTSGEAIPPSGHVAGQYARLPAHRAARSDTLVGASNLSQSISEHDQSQLSELRINALRLFSGRPGPVVWGLRSLSTDPQWRYLLTRRYAIYLEQSIKKGLQWAAFEINIPTLWNQVRVCTENFLYSEWLSGALIGDKPEQALFVKCDRSTMTQADIDTGRLVIQIGYAILKPAEFAVVRIELKTAS